MKRWLEKVTYHHHISNRPSKWPKWNGLLLVKYPTDMINYAQILFANKPDFLIECGTQHGGSAHFFADVMNVIGNGRVITIEKYPGKVPHPPPHPRITYLYGSSTSQKVLDIIKTMTSGSSVMVSLDSDHHRVNVKRELWYYSLLVTKGQFLVLEDIFPDHTRRENGVKVAAKWFLGTNRGKQFEIVPIENDFIYSLNIWLKKR